MTVPSNTWNTLSKHKHLLIFLIGAVALYAFYISGLSHNPPGSYLDESGGAYNAYLIATTGKSEFGIRFPLYFQFYTENAIEYSNSPHIYLMSLMYLFVPPSIFAARVMAGTMVFLATMMLGLLAARISGRKSVGVILAIIAVATPWLFEASRLILEVFIYPISLVLFLYFLYRAQVKEKWTIVDNASIGAALGLLTYSYTIGRLLAPMLALGLILFGLNRRAFLNILKTWVAYGISLLPLVIFYLSNPDAISKRFKSITYISAEKPLTQNIWEFLQSYFADISPDFLLYSGDPLLRHHVPGMGGLLAATFVLAIVGLIVILIKHRTDHWWQFVIYGLLVSVIPGALTMQRYHSLRLIGFPIFLLLITVPAIVWLIGERRSTSPAINVDAHQPFAASARVLGIGLLGIVMVLTVFQSFVFHSRFAEAGESRSYVFDGAYPKVLNEALSRSDRPIYLEDGFWGPAYIHAYWYGTIWGVPPSNFIHLAERQLPAIDSVVITSNTTCNSCEILFRSGNYLLYRYTGREGTVEPSTRTEQPVAEARPSVVPSRVIESQHISLDARTPRGIAVGKDGEIYVADSGNGKIQKLSSTGQLLTMIGSQGSGDGELGEPTGVAIDPYGSLYVTDGQKKRIVKFAASGTFEEYLQGPIEGFSYPTDISFGPDKQLYISDRANSQIIRIEPKTGASSKWGSSGNGDGQFGSIFGIESAGDNIFVADTQNDRIQLFGSDGKFVSQWPVQQWAKYIWHRPDIAVDFQSKRAYVTSGWSQEVLVFDLEGNLLESLKPVPPTSFNNPSSIALYVTSSGGRRLYVLNTGSDVVATGPPSILVFNLPESKGPKDK
ncbi:MAG: hypothetical protein QM785_11540 [Pyrinomonadaceae bacterium]